MARINQSALKHSEFKLVTRRQIRHVTRKLVEHLDPDKIILFGSYAYGKPTIDSDVDVLIVMQSRARPIARAIKAYRAVQGKPFPMDILVRTPKEVDYRLGIGDCFFKEIVERGKVLYAR
ncbi:MAG: nucleotidyltransferase domain-containing protein [Chloroflexi bacterium]|nr:nucleotidyltransferase domain-containing protein [Chloroflexota bacterium]